MPAAPVQPAASRDLAKALPPARLPPFDDGGIVLFGLRRSAVLICRSQGARALGGFLCPAGNAGRSCSRLGGRFGLLGAHHVPKALLRLLPGVNSRGERG